VAAGPALNRGGGWYGRSVNLASRLTGAANPGAIIATQEVVTAAGAAYAWDPLPARRLKGIEREVEVFQLR